MDDEYFRDIIATAEETAEHPEALKVSDTILRSLQRPQKRRYLIGFKEKVVDVQIKSRSGLFLGSKQAYQVDAPRIEGVIHRIVKGFFHREYSLTIPADYSIDVIWPQDVYQIDDAIISSLLELKGETFGKGVFYCGWASYELDKNSTFWIMLFYEKLPFIARTQPSQP